MPRVTCTNCKHNFSDHFSGADNAHEVPCVRTGTRLPGGGLVYHPRCDCPKYEPELSELVRDLKQKIVTGRKAAESLQELVRQGKITSHFNP